MSPRATAGRTTGFLVAGLLVALLLAGVVSNFAAATPDGLDAAATRGCTTDAAGEITGGSCIAQGARDHELGDSPLADYGLRAVGEGPLSTGLAGVTGVLLTFGLAGGLFWLSRRRNPRAAAPAGSAAPATPTAASTSTAGSTSTDGSTAPAGDAFDAGSGATPAAGSPVAGARAVAARPSGRE